MRQLCKQSAIQENQSLSFEHGGHRFFIVCKNNAFHAYLNRCPHRKISLDWNNNQFLTEDRELIQCATHGALFDVESGLCLSGPCVNDSLTCLPLHLANDHIYINPTDFEEFSQR